ncbi:response regulator [filamentous cyanobacterium LEGE 11480]|uniref:Response regulator n=1 Tax=Romeriopsis navalis LEGE 11480 TaxID=2777977 RepID=A0A928VMK6_9CYAN|nr:response regulator [Romeriopsis navalis]MBE9029152.1 response regulator [Romeriopsis navalis LEGE 11480]
MPKARKTITILVAEDDEDDRLLMEEALEENRLANDLHFVGDGEELMDYLCNRGQYHDPATAPRPSLILLDLNMPRKDGREALQEIKADPHLRQIPIVVLTTSKAEEDILRTYDLGVSSFIAKPVVFESMVQIMKTLGTYWFEIVELPDRSAD